MDNSQLLSLVAQSVKRYQSLVGVASSDSNNSPACAGAAAAPGNRDDPEEDDRKPAAEPPSKESIRDLEEAIKLLPKEETAAYFRVKKEQPDLIEKESNPMNYLKYDKYNTWAAGKRLCLYWHKRVAAFQERALLPMNQTGEGALSKQDCSQLSTAYWTFPSTDEEGRSIAIQDLSALQKDDVQSRKRVFFYLNHIVLQNPQTVEKGVLLISILSDTAVEKFTRLWGQQPAVHKAFPWSFNKVHFIPKFRKLAILEEVAPYCLSVVKQAGLEDRHCVHVLKNKRDAVHKLAKYGIRKDNLPESLGGTYTYEKFIIWQERQIRIEWELPLGALDESDGKYKARLLSELNPEERKERKRRYNIVHSRRKRRRDRVEAEVIKRQAGELEQEYEDLADENQVLQSLLKKAEAIVAQLPP